MDVRSALTALVAEELPGLANIADRIWASHRAVREGGRVNRMQAGSGMDFLDFRAYEPGEPMRGVDWRASSRQDGLVVRRYNKEAFAEWYICVDRSASMMMGDGSAWVLAAKLACVFLYLLMHRSDRVGLILFSDKIEGWNAPGLGRAHFKRCLDLLCDTPRGEGGASRPEVCIPRIVPQNSVMLVSDFLRPDAMTEGLGLLARIGGELHALQVRADAIGATDPETITVLRDVESREERDIGSSGLAAGEIAARNLGKLEERLERYCRRRRIPFTRCLPEESLRVKVVQHLSSAIASHA